MTLLCHENFCCTSSLIIADCLNSTVESELPKNTREWTGIRGSLRYCGLVLRTGILDAECLT